MSYEIINLTLPFVIQQIEDVLADYPKYPYQAAFCLHELRQKLITYTLSHLPNKYTVIESGQAPAANTNVSYITLEQRLNMENLIRGGILHLLRENADWLSLHLPQETKI